MATTRDHVELNVNNIMLTAELGKSLPSTPTLMNGHAQCDLLNGWRKTLELNQELTAIHRPLDAAPR